jgi:hypothetical protein
MARIRTIKPEFWQDEELSALPADTHILAAALLNYADDEGYFNANPKLIKAATTPLREEDVTTKTSLISLSQMGFIEQGTAPDGKRYGRIINFTKHQYINKKTDSKIKNLGIVWDVSGIPTVLLPSSSALERNREQGTGNRERNREPEGDAGKPKKKNLTDDRFEEFRLAYPRDNRKGVAKAREKWKSRGYDDIANIIIAKTRAFVAEDTGWSQGFVPNLLTFVNGEMWNDEIRRRQAKNANTGTHTGKGVAELRAAKEAAERIRLSEESALDRQCIGQTEGNIYDMERE